MLGLVLLTYGPVWHGGFLWNDSDYVTRPELRNTQGLFRIWTEVGATEQYYPLLHSFFWIEHRCWGDSATGYHLANMFWHACSAWLLAMTLLQLRMNGAWIAASFFALHPVCVESVAWVAEQKNTLSLFFYLGAMWCYLRFDESGRKRDYWIALGIFFCALLSKSLTATLPAALLVISWWRRGMLSWRRDILPLLPWFQLGAIVGVFTAWVERVMLKAEGDAFLLTLSDRFALAGRIVWFYFGKSLWPTHLNFIYPRWDSQNSRVINFVPIVALLIVAAGCWSARRQARAPLATLLLFVGSLFPVLGFFNVYGFNFSFVADHWNYISLIVLCAAGGVTLGNLATVAARGRLLLASAIFVGLGFVSYLQSKRYANVEMLYRTTLDENPKCLLAALNLSSVLFESGRFDESVSYALLALKSKPDYAPALYQLGTALAVEGQVDRAIPFLREAVRQRVWFAEAHGNLGVALKLAGQTTEARQQLEAALRLKPDLAYARKTLSTLTSHSSVELK